MGRRPAIRKTAAAVKRHQKQLEAAWATWVLRRQRLLQLIDAMQTNKSMQDQRWVDGQVRHYRKMLANHDAAMPPRPVGVKSPSPQPQE